MKQFEQNSEQKTPFSMIHVKWIEKRLIKARNKMKYKSIQRNLFHWAYLVNHMNFRIISAQNLNIIAKAKMIGFQATL